MRYFLPVRDGGYWFEHDPDNPTKRETENSNQLYDLKNDPGEQKNVYSQHPEVARRLKKRLDEVK
ncbi:MAG: hypothetical protein AB3N63_05975 [Puniceicoccaceae bacterium]